MQVILNGTVRELIPLRSGAIASGTNASTQTLSLQLTPEDLRLPELDVRIRTRLQDPLLACTEGISSEGFLHILPDTALAFSVPDHAITSVRGYLSTLPTEVRLGVAPAAGPEALRAAWLLSQELQIRGHAVSFSGPSGEEHVMVAPRELLAGFGLDTQADQAMALVSTKTEIVRQRLVISEPYHVDMLAAPWSDLLAGNGYQNSTGAPLYDSIDGAVALRALGLDTEAREFLHSVEWTLAADSRLLAGRQASALRLNLIAPPSTDENPISLYALQGSSVRGLSTLPVEGGTHSVEIRLGRTPDGPAEPLRLVMSRASSTSCEGPLVQGYVQLLPDSVLLTSSSSRAPDSIADFARGFSGVYSVHLPASAPAEPHAWIELLSQLGRTLNLDPRLAEFDSTTIPPANSRPFIWLGETPPEGFDAAIAFDRGRIHVTDGSENVLLDSGELPGVSVVSLLRDGDQRGLWLRGLDGGIAQVPPGVEGNAGDLVFGDRNSILVSLHTRSDSIPGLAYPDHVSWTDQAARYRGWIFGLIWVALTIAVILVTRRLRKY